MFILWKITIDLMTSHSLFEWRRKNETVYQFARTTEEWKYFSVFLSDHSESMGISRMVQFSIFLFRISGSEASADAVRFFDVVSDSVIYRTVVSCVDQETGLASDFRVPQAAPTRKGMPPRMLDQVRNRRAIAQVPRPVLLKTMSVVRASGFFLCYKHARRQARLQE